MSSIPLQSLSLSSPERVCTKCGLLKRLEEFSIKVSATSRRDTRCKTCVNAYCAVRYAAHPERQHAASNAWRATHQDQIKAANASYSASHREEIAAKGAEWRTANPERQRARTSAWRSENRERHDALIAAWGAENPGRRCAQRVKRTQHIDIPGPHFTGQEWEALKARYDYRCLMCTRQEPKIKLEADHVIPIARGGTNDIGNIQPLCKSCNSSKNDQIRDYRR